MRILNSCEV